MKQILSLLDGALVVSEDAGVISISLNESVGGGAAKDIVSGSASIKLNAMLGLQLGEKLLNAHLPASVLPLAQVIEGAANQAIAAIL